jgi:hypothetical protein
MLFYLHSCRCVALQLLRGARAGKANLGVCIQLPLAYSVRINERPARRVVTGLEPSPSSYARADQSKDNKKIAYLLDLENIRVVDLATGINVATINHDAKVCCRT